MFGLATLRELPDIERLEDEWLLQKSREHIDLGRALGLGDGDQLLDDDFDFDETELG